MARSDFDVEGLAAYLHLTPAQVAKMVNRGKLPGRKIGGQWRFAEAEIHHWLEERIGVSDEQELSGVELVLERASGEEEPLSLTAMMPLEAMAVPLAARTRSSVIHAMCQLAVGTGMLWDPDKMLEAVKARETLHPTALDSGVALLHPRRPLASILAEPLLALGVTSQGLPFGQRGGVLTDVFFLICSTDDRGHLRTLARLSRLIQGTSCLDQLRSAESAAEARQIVEDHEGALNA